MRRSVILAALSQNQPSSSDSPSSSSSSPGATSSPSVLKKPNSNSLSQVRSANGGGYGALLGSKPFKTPFAKVLPRGEGTGRKRKRIDYSGLGGDDNDEDASVTDKNAPRKCVKSLEGAYKGIDATGVSLNVDNRTWKVFAPKDGAIKRGFSVPTMKTKEGRVIETQLTHAALGTRRAVDIPPRPLHDPMGEHSIVLFDPTIDDVDAEKEKERIRQAQEETEKANQQLKGPHKSLAELLGLNKKKEKVIEKVPVVIDPRLGKVLRPHQIEGVKVSQYMPSTGHRRVHVLTSLDTHHSSYTAALLVSSIQRQRDVSWQMRWVLVRRYNA